MDINEDTFEDIILLAAKTSKTETECYLKKTEVELDKTINLLYLECKDLNYKLSYAKDDFEQDTTDYMFKINEIEAKIEQKNKELYLIRKLYNKI